MPHIFFERLEQRINTQSLFTNLSLPKATSYTASGIPVESNPVAYGALGPYFNQGSAPMSPLWSGSQSIQSYASFPWSNTSFLEAWSGSSGLLGPGSQYTPYTPYAPYTPYSPAEAGIVSFNNSLSNLFDLTKNDQLYGFPSLQECKNPYSPCSCFIGHCNHYCPDECPDCNCAIGFMYSGADAIRFNPDIYKGWLTPIVNFGAVISEWFINQGVF